MKPNTPGAQAEPAGKTGPFKFLERFLNAPASNDPLYLTNATFGQRMRRAAVLVTPIVVVVGLIVVGIFVFGPKSKAEKALTPAEIANNILPNFPKNIRLDSNQDLEVMEVHFDYSSGGYMLGSLKNKTNRTIDQAVVVFDLADYTQSQLGGVTVTEDHIEPGAVRSFRKAIEQQGATSAVVREVRTK